MVFVDISGFTAMSERLAKHGKLGAEELTAVIAATFHELLAAAYSFGPASSNSAETPLLFFTGDEHVAFAPRPVRCSRGWMRSASVSPVPERSRCGCRSASTAACSTSSWWVAPIVS